MTFTTLLQNRDQNVSIILPVIVLSIDPHPPEIVTTGDEQPAAGIGGAIRLPSVRKEPIFVKIPRLEIELQLLGPVVLVSENKFCQLPVITKRSEPLAPRATVGYDDLSEAFADDILSIIATL